MAKYIDAENLTSTIRKVRTKYAIDSAFGINLRENAAAAGALEAVAQVIDIMPAADVVGVRHGRWVWGMQDLCYYCSECDYMGVTQKYIYCPNCGAKMDGEQNG